MFCKRPCDPLRPGCPAQCQIFTNMTNILVRIGTSTKHHRDEKENVFYSTVQYSTVQYSTVLYCTIQLFGLKP